MSPRPGPRREPKPLRMSPAEWSPVDRRAEAESGGNASEMLRRLIAWAHPRMPVGWTPNKEET